MPRTEKDNRTFFSMMYTDSTFHARILLLVWKRRIDRGSCLLHCPHIAAWLWHIPLLWLYLSIYGKLYTVFIAVSVIYHPHKQQYPGWIHHFHNGCSLIPDAISTSLSHKVSWSIFLIRGRLPLMKSRKLLHGNLVIWD